MSALVNYLVTFFTGVFNWVWDTVVSLISYSANQIWASIGYVFHYIFAHLPTGLQGWLGSNNTVSATLLELADDLDWFIGWKSCLAIFVFAITLQGSVRLMRWVLGIRVAGFSVGS